MNSSVNKKIISFFLISSCIISVNACKPSPRNTNQAATETIEGNDQSKPTPEIFRADYTPPSGIRYQPTIINDGAVQLNVEAALKNVCSVKASEFGKTFSYQILGDFEDSSNLTLIPIEEGYLASGLNGVWLVNKDMKQERMLFRNDVKAEGDEKFRYYSINFMLQAPYYDASSGLLRAYCSEQFKEQKKTEYSIATFMKEELLASDTTLTKANIYSRLPLKKGLGLMGRVIGIEGGYGVPEQFTNNLYTFGVQGDTLCRFTLGEAVNYAPTGGGNYRSGESPNVYYNNGKAMIRLPYGNTFYRLKDASTLEAAYILNFGSLHQVTGKEVTGTGNVDNSYFVSGWQEADDYIFMQIDRGYNTPNAREAKTVTPYSLIYNKQTGAFCSLPLFKDKVAYQQIEGDLKDGVPFWPNCIVDGKPSMILSGSAIKQNHPGILKQHPALKELKDGEVVLITIR